MFASFRSVLTLTLAAVFATSCVALPSTSGHSVAAKRGLSPIEIDIGSIVQPIKKLVTPTPTKRMTNAQRMARGLPPNPPHRRSGALKARQSSTPVALCTPRDGLIQAYSATDGSPMGYVSKPTDEYGNFGITTDPTDAVVVHANCDGEFFDLPTLNVDTDYPNMGLFSGLANSGNANDLATRSPNYAQFTSTGHTDPGSSAQAQGNEFSEKSSVTVNTESAIWSLDDTTSVLTPSWVNEDGSRPTTFIAHISDSNVLYLTGDFDAFQSGSGSVEDVHELTFKLADAPQ